MSVQVALKFTAGFDAVGVTIQERVRFFSGYYYKERRAQFLAYYYFLFASQSQSQTSNNQGQSGFCRVATGQSMEAP